MCFLFPSLLHPLFPYLATWQFSHQMPNVTPLPLINDITLQQLQASHRRAPQGNDSIHQRGHSSSHIVDSFFTLISFISLSNFLVFKVAMVASV